MTEIPNYYLLNKPFRMISINVLEDLLPFPEHLRVLIALTCKCKAEEQTIKGIKVPVGHVLASQRYLGSLMSMHDNGSCKIYRILKDLAQKGYITKIGEKSASQNVPRNVSRIASLWRVNNYLDILGNKERKNNSASHIESESASQSASNYDNVLDNIDIKKIYKRKSAPPAEEKPQEPKTAMYGLLFTEKELKQWQYVYTFEQLGYLADKIVNWAGQSKGNERTFNAYTSHHKVVLNWKTRLEEQGKVWHAESRKFIPSYMAERLENES